MKTTSFLQLFLKNVFLASALSWLMISPLFASSATDSTAIKTNHQTVTTMQACFTHLKLTSPNPNIGGTSGWTVFSLAATPAQGGILCPGKYTVNNLYCTISTQGGCGGSSCGWGATLYNVKGTAIGSQSSHDGCQASHGNICQNVNNVNIYITTSAGYLDTNVDTGGLSVNIYSESGGTTYSSCTIEITSSSLY